METYLTSYICLLHDKLNHTWFQLFSYIHKSIKYIITIRGGHMVVYPMPLRLVGKSVKRKLDNNPAPNGKFIIS